MQAMKTLKKKVIIALVLIGINYASNISEIIVAFNANMQE